MAVEVMRPASTGEEVLALKKYIAKGVAQQEQLMLDLQVNKDREEFLERYRHEARAGWRWVGLAWVSRGASCWRGARGGGA